MMHRVLELLIWLLVICLPIWVFAHAIVIAQTKRPVLYFELRQLSGRGNRLAKVALLSWTIAMSISTVLFVLVVSRFLVR